MAISSGILSGIAPHRFVCRFKPVNLNESATQAKDVFVFGPYQLNITDRVLRKGEEPLSIGGRAMDLLVVLLESAGEVVSKKELLSKAWPNATVDPANLRVHVAALRRAFDPGGDGLRYIANVSGRGYCFVAPVQRSADDPRLRFGAHSMASSIGQLPTRRIRMVGRDETVDQLCAELKSRRFVTVVGAGGVGKTTVAIAAAHAFASHVHGSIGFVDLSSLADPTSLPSIVGSTFGCPLQSQDPSSALVTFLREKSLLLVLDNCESARDAAAEIAERIHRHVARAHIIATSREALRAAGEHVHILNSLDCPPNSPNLTANEIQGYPAAQLFLERAAAAGLKTPLRDPDAADVARICRQLDGIPLALELAASRVGSLGLLGTADHLDSSFAFVWKGRRTGIARHQTIATMLDWSYRLLSEPEKAILCRASVFVADFTNELAAAVSMEAHESRQTINDALAGLVAKSLISASACDGETRYHFLEITRAYAAIKLNERGESNDVRRRHAVIFEDLLEQHTGPRSVFDPRSFPAQYIHVGDIRAALVWALSERGNPDIGVRLAALAAPLLIQLSLFDECRRSCRSALALLPKVERGQRIEMVLQEAVSYTSMFTRGNSSEVLASLQRGLTIAADLNESTQQLHFLAGLNTFLYRTGDFHGALAVARQAIQVATVSKIPTGLVMAEWMLGVAYHCVGNQDAAERHCQQGFANSIDLSEQDPAFFGYDHRVRALVGMAGTLWLRGYANRAISIAEQAIREAEVRNQPISLCISLYTAQVFLRAGLVERAAELSERLTEYATQYGLGPFRSVGLAFQGELALQKGQLSAGVELLRHALSSLQSEQHNILHTVFSGALAEGLRRLRHLDEALLTIDQAIGLATGSGAAVELSELLRVKAKIMAAITPADPPSAIKAIQHSLEVGRQQAALAYQLRSAVTFARLESKQTNDYGAMAILGSIYEQFTEGFETPDLRAARIILNRLG
jgi:predicted ATPase/DNA-binding winged helix-turn-helix (wHTH) protein